MSTREYGTKPSRVVSLVPSYTESLFDLGCGDRLVGITDYCIHPGEKVKNIYRVGGPKTPRITDIIALMPDLVLANQEENIKGDIEELENAGIPVWAAFPRTVRESINDLWTLVKMFNTHQGLIQLNALERSFDIVEKSTDLSQTFTFFCPVWQESGENGNLSWITISDDTYTSDLLKNFGGLNCIGGVSADRYPKITYDQVVEFDPEVIFLPSEPFYFTETNRKQFLDLFSRTKAGKAVKVCLLEGTLITWYGTRLGKALNEIPPLISSLIS
jgi:iron complex transport system substrate-binding protein